MKYLDLKKELKDYVIFTQNDIKKFDVDFHEQRLNEWQKKGYIKKIIKGFYIFTDLEVNKNHLYIFSNKAFTPSYISFESALSFYGLIPESILSTTAASSKNTYKFKSCFGDFIYRKIKPSLMFGYKLIKYNNYTFKIAEVEKAILDLFYIKQSLRDKDDFEGLRINTRDAKKLINNKKLNSYLKEFKNKSLTERITRLKEYIKDA